ncbi:VOC family protein [Sinorhizobium alkalisoli]|uniref:Glyoxalase n=1 Tax=Sinorhizobium alkalisoli TaxID=1752398 RepID=A0A1E3VBM8_9HYPH|nr:VOC family protein [Sinorhizobium alkalisoli]MCA1491988.1 VOC family protein [Ensifer sp. NBAIM29]MCG5479457.1 VOC family protein [Sinorhizobium alkalisoli]ODR90531.1 glyoxalase [Sinorhizobium alkalisoli]QFI67667.1 putative hydroxylase [Sinorhizobium alkalisoli]
MHGKFVWYELMTTDTKAAEAFYKKVIGWSARDAGMPGTEYTLFSIGDHQVAGLMTMPEGALDMNVPPAWLGYVAVDDVDAAAAKLTGEGGTVHREPDDIPGIGRFAVVTDPHGAAFALFTGTGEPPPSLDQMAPGNIGWHELMAGDLDSAFAFYSELFGWTKDQAMDMGEMGVYQLFAHNGQAIGGMMTKPRDVPAPYWLYYFNVEALDAAIDRARSEGAQVVVEPMEVPGGAWIVQCTDPQGALFALVAPKR